MSNQLTAALISASVAELPSGYITMPHPHLDGDINVKIHTVAEREEFERKAYYSDSELKQYPQRAVTFAYAVVDDKGERLFTDEQIPEISKWPAYITVPVHLKYNELNNIGPEKIEAATKNS